MLSLHFRHGSKYKTKEGIRCPVPPKKTKKKRKNGQKIKNRGLRNIHALTASGAYQLRIDFTAFDGREYYARYDDFSVGRNSRDPEKDGYPLLVSGYSGDAGDKLSRHSGMKFSTKDRDQDTLSNTNCASYWKGAWWYRECHSSNLNGLYKESGTCDGTNAVWHYLGGPKSTCLRFVEMKIRPRK
ncbi:fibrinogen C domain-containing protein 1 [Syngnathus scovelli]|uniref:fibrinogen C domain-containing protein 1 n=1 Tax=Syngnathus scovelli TaxID=161590 RepID=UPI002110DB44|nr:fibrinogen C domain-containing protein 1 [Syngnathus scovelli]